MGHPPGDKYPSPDAAARAALNDIMPKSSTTGNEYSGAIYPLGPGGFSYTAPVVGQGATSPWVSAPDGKTLVAEYHTHPFIPGYDGESFSPSDMNNGNSFNVPIYIETPSGAIKKYVPGKKIPGSKGRYRGPVIILGPSLNRMEPLCPTD